MNVLLRRKSDRWIDSYCSILNSILCCETDWDTSSKCSWKQIKTFYYGMQQYFRGLAIYLSRLMSIWSEGWNVDLTDCLTAAFWFCCHIFSSLSLINKVLIGDLVQHRCVPRMCLIGLMWYDLWVINLSLLVIRLVCVCFFVHVFPQFSLTLLHKQVFVAELEIRFSTDDESISPNAAYSLSLLFSSSLLLPLLPLPL